MIRTGVAIIVFLSLYAIQTSFINSLPGIFAMMPLFLAASVYLIQHHNLALGALWLVLFGLLLDLTHISAVPFETITYAITGIVALISSRRIFSNRSLYGVLGCGLLSYLTLTVSHISILFLINLQGRGVVIWNALATEVLWSGIATVILLIFLFQFAGSIRTVLIKSFLLSDKYGTY